MLRFCLFFLKGTTDEAFFKWSSFNYEYLKEYIEVILGLKRAHNEHIRKCSTLSILYYRLITESNQKFRKIEIIRSFHSHSIGLPLSLSMI